MGISNEKRCKRHSKNEKPLQIPNATTTIIKTINEFLGE